MCTSPDSSTRPAGGGLPPAGDEYDPLHRGRAASDLTTDELLERIVVMLQLGPILRLLTGHDHCPVCLGCRRAED